MLVLSRHRDEFIVIRDPKTGLEGLIQVVDIRGNKVRLGVALPPDVEVHRLEVFKAIHGRLPSPFAPKGPENE